jgi:hypothetical protein
MHFSFKFKWTVLREFRCRTELQMILSVGRAVVPTKPLIYQDLSLNETKCFAPSPRRPYVEDKRMVLEHTHGLFIT